MRHKIENLVIALKRETTGSRLGYGRCRGGLGGIGWFKLLFHLYNTDTSKGNTELISGMHYTNGIQIKVSRLIQICIPFCTITYVYSILHNFFFYCGLTAR